MSQFNFDGLFILDMANNHQGDMKHALAIIEALGKVCAKHGVRGALKFQFRHLDTFIHPDFKKRDDVKHIPRFMSTALSQADYAKLTKAVRNSGMVTICTPFDEISVDHILKLDMDIIKIASCSAADRPLLEKVARAGKPVVASTAGLSTEKIDRLVSLLESHNVHFAVMHCVGIYPTPNDKLNLNQIQLLIERFPHIPIGFSTHEDPDDFDVVKMAYAKGARLFERHVGLEAGKHKLNAYSSSPEQIDHWFEAYHKAVQACGGEHRSPATPDEIASLQSLMRGVFAKKEIKKGATIKREDVFFSMPLQEGQLVSGDWIKDLKADQSYKAREPLSEKLVDQSPSDEELIFHIMLQIKGMLNNARIFIGKDNSIELSHHYGLARFREFGAVIINCINRAYCKKLIVQLPRQKHPYHFHKKKEETFQLLYGDLEIEVEGKIHRLEPGDTLLVEPGQWHKFHTLHGAIFEEVSTTHFNDDSFYEDERIAGMARNERKTVIAHWNDVLKQNH